MVKLYIERNANRYKRTGRTVQYTAQLALWANYLYTVLEKRKNCRKFKTKKFGISNSSFSHRLLGHWALEKIGQRIIAKRGDKVRHRGFALVFFRVRNAEFVVE